MKKATALLLASILALIAALPVSDAFTDSDGVALATHNASWTVITGVFEIYSNGVRPTYAGRGLARWTGETFSNNQYAEGVAGLVGADGLMGLAVRIPTNGDTTGYSLLWSENGTYLGKLVAGSYTSLADTTAPAVGSLMRIEANETTVRVLKNSVEILSVTDTELTSGVAGITSWYGGPYTRMDSWAAGDISGSRRRQAVVVQ